MLDVEKNNRGLRPVLIKVDSWLIGYTSTKSSKTMVVIPQPCHENTLNVYF
jgi:hypothetical protein